MKRATDLKRAGEDLGAIVALMEMINRYMATQKKSGTKTPKQNDRALLKVLKSQYRLEEGEVAAILDRVAGKKADTKESKAALSESDRNALKGEIDQAIAALGITIRESNLDEPTYLKKIKANLSVRKGKLMAQLDPSREKKRGRPRSN